MILLWCSLVCLLTWAGSPRVVVARGDHDEHSDRLLDGRTVHLVPFSHTDPGWKLTFSDYARHQVRAILETVLVELARDPGMTFTWGEPCFLRHFVDAEHHDQLPRRPSPPADTGAPSWLALLRRLTAAGRFDVVGGGWVQADEALVSLFGQIDQTRLGFDWLKRRLNVSVTTGWQCDAFGHSAATAGLMRDLGVPHLVLNRVGGSTERDMDRHAWKEFWWQPVTGGSADDAPSSVDLAGAPFVHVIHRHYAFSGLEALRSLVASVARRASVYTGSPHLLVLWGDDFRFEQAREFDDVRQALTTLRAAFPAATVSLSTVSQYMGAAASATGPALGPRVRADQRSFLPYVEDPLNVWTGYYAQRAWLKNLIRQTEREVRAAQMAALLAADPSTSLGVLERAERWTALGQHHDALTGTCSDALARELLRNLREARRLAGGLISLGGGGGQMAATPAAGRHTHALNVSDLRDSPVALRSMGGTLLHRQLLLVNSLGWRRSPSDLIEITLQLPDAAATTIADVKWARVRAESNDVRHCQLTVDRRCPHSATLFLVADLAPFSRTPLTVELSTGHAAKGDPGALACTVVPLMPMITDLLELAEIGVNVHVGRPSSRQLSVTVCTTGAPALCLRQRLVHYRSFAGDRALFGIVLSSGPYVMRVYEHVFFWLAFAGSSLLGSGALSCVFCGRTGLRRTESLTATAGNRDLGAVEAQRARGAATARSSWARGWCGASVWCAVTVGYGLALDQWVLAGAALMFVGQVEEMAGLLAGSLLVLGHAAAQALDGTSHTRTGLPRRVALGCALIMTAVAVRHRLQPQRWATPGLPPPTTDALVGCPALEWGVARGPLAVQLRAAAARPGCQPSVQHELVFRLGSAPVSASALLDFRVAHRSGPGALPANTASFVRSELDTDWAPPPSASLVPFACAAYGGGPMVSRPIYSVARALLTVDPIAELTQPMADACTLVAGEALQLHALSGHATGATAIGPRTLDIALHRHMLVDDEKGLQWHRSAGRSAGAALGSPSALSAVNLRFQVLRVAGRAAAADGAAVAVVANHATYMSQAAWQERWRFAEPVVVVPAASRPTPSPPDSPPAGSLWVESPPGVHVLAWRPWRPYEEQAFAASSDRHYQMRLLVHSPVDIAAAGGMASWLAKWPASHRFADSVRCMNAAATLFLTCPTNALLPHRVYTVVGQIKYPF